jgi:hypothetical protein
MAAAPAIATVVGEMFDGVAAYLLIAPLAASLCLTVGAATWLLRLQPARAARRTRPWR